MIGLIWELVGAVGGALFSELLKLVIEEAKKIKDFKPLSKELVSTMERLIPLTTIIDSKQNELSFGLMELQELWNTFERANKAILEFPSVSFYKKSKYTRKFEKINEDMLKFCQIELQLLQYRNQLEILRMTRNIRGLVPVFGNLCSVPKLDKVLVELEWPVMEVKKKLLDNSIANIVVSAPPGSGKTTLVMQLCDDPEIKGKFKHIFYNVVTSTPNFRVIVQNLLEHNGYRSLTFENDPQAVVVLRQLLENLQEKGPILMVLDDVWPGAEFFLQNLQINMPDYKILVTSRSDFPSFGFNYHLRPLKMEDATALQVQWASRPDNVSRAEYEYLLQKLSLINEQQEKEEKRKYKVGRDVDFTEQIGNNIYFDLVDHEKVWSFRIQKQTPFYQFKVHACIFLLFFPKNGLFITADEVEEDGKLPKVNPPSSMYGGSNSVIQDGRSVNVSGWHPECLICDACDKQIDKDHVSNSRGNFHKSCYDRYCYICKGKVKTFAKHPYWKELYCFAHETDGTPKCCSCERLQPRGMDYVMFDDGRLLCLGCMESAVMDSYECQPLHCEIREFFEVLNIKIDKEFPFLLVENHALNKAEKEEKIDYEFERLTRGICLSEEQIVDSVTRRPTMGLDNKLRGLETEAQRVVRECEVTAILIVYGLPRLLTGYILAHEMMRAFFRLNGHRNLNKLLEEGICQVLAHMWLESQTYTCVNATAAAASSSASSGSALKKGECSDFEKGLVGFFKYQIETDDTPLYGEGFRECKKKTHINSLETTIKEVLRRSGR